ncbi:MAG: rhamnogalacturonan acetylesterase [Treponema sp.]|nr:rhamnogalacturonan acetylesterase [Treponema sp.]
MGLNKKGSAGTKLIFLGDSTVRNGTGDGSNGQWGWGDQIARYFDPELIEVVNCAWGGRSSRTFISEGKWSAVLEMIDKGDFVLIQFGHNDSSPVNDDSRARGTLPGTGNEVEEIDNLLTGMREIVHTFGWYLRRYVRDTIEKGAVPVLVSPVPRKNFDENGRIRRSSSDYALWARQVALSEKIPFIDLNEIAAAVLDNIIIRFGLPVLDAYFKDDHTHSSLAGAKLNAALVVKALKGLENCALKNYCLDRTYLFDSFHKEDGPGIHLSGNETYHVEKGYGFDFGTTAEAKVFFFSLALPEGNYEVTLELGSDQGDTETTVRGESRRLFLKGIKTPKGRYVKESFTINIRTKQIDKNREVRLNSREINKLNWDEKLTLELNGTNPGLKSLRIYPAEISPEIPAEFPQEFPVTVFLCGDSTVVDQDNEPWCGWGQMLPCFFNAGVSIANYAESGESAAGFIAGGRLEKLLTHAMAGDYMFIQFGHNDQKQTGPGTGPWTNYTENLKNFIAECRVRGIYPVLMTPVMRRKFENNKVINTHGDYPDAVRKLAATEKIPLIDLHRSTKVLYEGLEKLLGQDGSKAAFVHYPAGTFPGQTGDLKDDSHFNDFGGYQAALLVVEGIRQNKLGLAAFLRPGTGAFDCSSPDAVTAVTDFFLPPSPFMDLEKPAGT